jgi:hypothetical protein
MLQAQCHSGTRIHQLDNDLQQRIREVNLTSLDEFRAIWKETQRIQEHRWRQAG